LSYVSAGESHIKPQSKRFVSKLYESTETVNRLQWKIPP